MVGKEFVGKIELGLYHLRLPVGAEEPTGGIAAVGVAGHVTEDRLHDISLDHICQSSIIVLELNSCSSLPSPQDLAGPMAS